MALKFLSKKKWHVRRLENIRKVAEAEAKLAEEQTRMAELRREREEEREFENIRKIQEASGRIPKQQPRLEFLYKTPPVKKQSEEDIITTADILQGRRPDSILFNKLDKKRVELGLPGVKWVYSIEPGKSDSNLKLREDPITGIIAKRKKMKQEQEERIAMLKKVQEARNSQIINQKAKEERTSDLNINNTSINAESIIDKSPPDYANAPSHESKYNNKSPPDYAANADNNKIQNKNNEVDEESLRIAAQMEEFERKQKMKMNKNNSDSYDYSDGYERRKKKHRSGHHHHHHRHHRHHRPSKYDYDYD